MKTAYLDCFSGISGDMCLGALVSAGVDFDTLQEQLRSIPVSGYTFKTENVSRRGIAATKVSVEIAEVQPCRRLKEIETAIGDSSLPREVKTASTAVFRNLAEAEARVHGENPEEIHLHEAGAVDAILDICGTVLGFHLLGVSRIDASPLPPGGGTVQCAHGLLPVPAPAVAELLKNIPLAPSPAAVELTTPTGAALAKTLAYTFGPIPAMKITSVGYGAGTRELAHPNLLRLLVGEIPETSDGSNFESDVVAIVETNIDDMNPEFYSHLGDRLLSAGCLDYSLTPLQMKKGRPGVKITTLCPCHLTDSVADILFSETTSLGCRVRTEARLKLRPSVLRVATDYGAVDVKYNLRMRTFSPEYSQCEELAITAGVSVKAVYDAARAAAFNALSGQSE